MALFLKPTSEKVKKSKVYGFDVETYGDKNIFLMGSIVGENEKYVFWDKKEMQDFILTSKTLRSSTLYATNLSFDFLVLFGDNYKMLSQFEFILRGSSIIHISYMNKKSKYSIYFSDTMNFIKLGVANIGKIMKIQKLPKPSFLGKIPKNATERKQLEIYNINDSYISYKFADFLQTGFNKMGCNIKYTIASTSMSLFKNKYLKFWIKQPQKEIMRELFKGYYGGRTEIFQRGFITDSFYYDINSLYPSVMLNGVYPYPNTIKHSKKPTIDLINKYEGLSLCDFEIKGLKIPLLPFRTPDKLLFPLGKFTNFQTHIEIRKAIELGYKVTPKETYYFTKTFNPFKDFVKDNYEKRLKYQKEGNSMQILHKIAMNSLYGKLAQKLEQSRLYFVFEQKQKDIINKMFRENSERIVNGETERYKINTPDYRTYKENGIEYHEPRLYYVTDLDSHKYPVFINPILSIYVTSYARLELYKLFERVQKQNGKVLYCDTDSLITDIELNTSDKLGDIKKEYDIKEGLLIKPKFYYLKSYDDKEVYKIKGIMNINTYDDFYKLIKNRKTEYIKFTKFKESIRRGFGFNEKILVFKDVDLNDNKRKWKNENINIDILEESSPLTI